MSNDPVTPHADPEPEATQNPGGTDAVHDDPDDYPLVTPEPPVSAQMDEDVVPDEIQQLDEKQQAGDESGPDDDTSREPA